MINSHPLYRLSYRGMMSRKSYWMGCTAVNVNTRRLSHQYQQLIGLPSQRECVVRSLPLFDRQMTRGAA